MLLLFLCQLLWAEEVPSPALKKSTSVAAQATQVWQSLGLNRHAVAVVSAADGSLTAIDVKGRIYSLARDGRWIQRLGLALDGQQKNQEDILLDIESTLEEMIDLDDDDGFEVDEEEDAATPTQQGFDDEIESGLMDPLRSSKKSPDQRNGLWADSTANLLLACRADGCFRSRNSGKNWFKIADLPHTKDIVFAQHLSPALVIAATVDGIWTSSNQGRTWKRANKKTQSIFFTGLSTAEQIIYASSVDGIFFSMDGRLWAKIPTKNRFQQYRDIAISSAPSNTMWTATDSHLLTSKDGAQSWDIVPKKYPSGIRKIIHINHLNQLLLVTSRGVARSDDGGMRWELLQGGGKVRGIYDVIPWKNSLVCASRDGIFYLDTVDKKKDTPLLNAVKMLPLQDVVRRSLHDIDGQMAELNLKASMLKRNLIPTLSVYGEFDRNLSLATDYSSISSFGVEERDYRVGVELCFGGCGSVSTSTTLPVEDVMVIDGSVYASDAAGVVPAAAGISSSLIKYRQSMLNYVIGLYTTHQRLLRQHESIQSLSLLEQVRHELEIQEVVSRLDVVTDGTYYQRSNTLEE